MTFPMVSAPTVSRLLPAALILAGAALSGWAGCSNASFDLAVAAGGGSSSWSTASTSSGAGGTIIHDDGLGGAGEPPPPLAALCGEGCKPGTGESTACEEPAAGAGGGGGEPTTACRLVAGDNGEVLGTCGPAGPEIDGAPCLTSDDCAAGFGCVEPGVCRAYCCGDPEACPMNTHCAARKLAVSPERGLVSAPAIPVCAPVEPCTLLNDASCSIAGDTCTIVRLDGTTSCVEPGSGTAGEACPCAAGHVCSFADGRCWKLCRTDRSDDCPAGYQCSGGSKAYPSGFGICSEL